MAETGGHDVVVRVTRRGVEVGTPAAIARARAQFVEQQGVWLPGFMEPGLAGVFQRVIDRSEWHEKIHHGIEPPPKELCISDPSVFSRVHLLVNDRRLFDVIEAVTGCARIGCFYGRFYRMNSRLGHHDSWHDDLDGKRLVAMSVNFSAGPYGGGVLQLRDRPTRQMRWQFHNTGLGDAIVFNLAEDLEHCVSAIEDPCEKTAFAGWFLNPPQHEAWLRAALHPPPQAPSESSG